MVRSSHSLIPLVALVTTLAAACGADEPEAELTDIHLLSLNGLSVHALQSNLSSLSALAAAPFGDAGASTPLADSDEGRQLLSYIGGCALPAGESATIVGTGGAAVPVSGRLGFAPGWREAPLDPSDGRWVSACVLAHVNAFSLPVPISLRAAELGEPEGDEALEYDVQEAAFYGDLFAGGTPQMNACFGWHVAAELGYDGSLDTDTLDYLRVRVCSTEDTCGFNRAGACFNWGAPIVGDESRACDAMSGNFYFDCHDRPVGQGEMFTWPETITVHLKRVDFDRQVREYRALVGCSIDTLDTFDGGYRFGLATLSASCFALE